MTAPDLRVSPVPVPSRRLLPGCHGMRRGRLRRLAGPDMGAGLSHRKNYVKPLHVRLAADAGIPLANRPESWLDIAPRPVHATLTWPKDAQLPKPQERQAIETGRRVHPRHEGAKPKWQFTGPHLKLRLVPPVPPPTWVFLDRIEWSGGVRPPTCARTSIRAGDPRSRRGRARPRGSARTATSSRSASATTPRTWLSVDTGGGKSVRCGAFVQVLFRGGIVAILDNKLVSHPSLRGLPERRVLRRHREDPRLPGVARRELDRRARVHPVAH